MNKRALIKFVLLFIVTFLYVTFYFTSDNANSLGVMLIPLFLSITTFMFYCKNKIKKYNFIYDVILLLFMFFSIVISAYLIYIFILTLINSYYVDEITNFFMLIYPIFLLNTLIFSFFDINKKTNKNNDIMTIIVSILIILIYIRYYLDSNLVTIDNGYFDEYSLNYIPQNYIYFTMLYVTTFFHYIINKNTK